MSMLAATVESLHLLTVTSAFSQVLPPAGPPGPAEAAFSPYQAVQVALHIADRIDFQWGLFITVHLALFGGIIYVDRPLRALEKTGALLIYAGFAWLSYRLMIGQTFLMERAYEDISMLSRQPCCSDSAVLTHMAQALGDGKLQLSRQLIKWGHGAMLLLVVLSVILDQELNRMIKGGPANGGESDQVSSPGQDC